MDTHQQKYVYIFNRNLSWAKLYNSCSNSKCWSSFIELYLFKAQKYWRFRVYLLPLNHQATKKILDGSEHCDIYNQSTAEDQGLQVENFLKFLETWVNRIKRPNTCKKPRVRLNYFNKFRPWIIWENCLKEWLVLLCGSCGVAWRTNPHALDELK